MEGRWIVDGGGVIAAACAMDADLGVTHVRVRSVFVCSVGLHGAIVCLLLLRWFSWGLGMQGSWVCVKCC